MLGNRHFFITRKKVGYFLGKCSLLHRHPKITHAPKNMNKRSKRKNSTGESNHIIHVRSSNISRQTFEEGLTVLVLFSTTVIGLCGDENGWWWYEDDSLYLRYTVCGRFGTTHSVSFSLLATACSEPRGGNVDAAATGRKLIMWITIVVIIVLFRSGEKDFWSHFAQNVFPQRFGRTRFYELY